MLLNRNWEWFQISLSQTQICSGYINVGNNLYCICVALNNPYIYNGAAVKQYLIIFSINLVSLVTLRSSGTYIMYGCHLLLDVYIYIYIYVWKLNQTVLELDF